MADLDTERAERRMWLVRVPPHIAERWKAACQGPSGVDDGDDDGEGAGGGSLGSITFEQLTEGPRTTLELPEGMCDRGLPRRYRLVPAKELMGMSVMSSEGGGGGGGEGEPAPLIKPRLDGIVSHKYDAVPEQAAERPAQPDGSVAEPLDEAYRALTRKRTMASLTKGRSIAIITDDKASKQLYRSQHGLSNLYRKQTKEDKDALAARAESARALRGAGGAAGARRVRMERGELERALFGLFERQPQWAFPALQRETDQPSAWLRDVLGGVAQQAKKGAARDVWELQRQFQAAAAAASAAGGGGGGGAV
ncbi:MAG: transcription initiation factor IIF, beta subunit-domain-containing protein [Monoraphidium minutum]|nr:MAG: transcription initiation factor IIF, beta subunit-domain-containing protein [Monoraphidium minutum]